MIVYYAHSLHLYNSKQEERDIELLESMGFVVKNPNSIKVQEEVEKYRIEHGDKNVMNYFKDLIDSCGGLVFRAHFDGKIPSGVLFEVNYAKEMGLPILELPSLISTRNLSVDDTRECLKLLGQR